MVEEVERFPEKFQGYSLIEPERARHAEVDHFLARPAEPVEGFVWHHGKIERWRVKDGGIRSSAGEGDDGGEGEILKRVPRGRPRAVQHEALRLVQLRRTSFAPLIERIEIAGALVDGFGEGISNSARELWSAVPPRQKQSVIDGLARVVDGVDGAEVGIENAIHRFKFGHYVRCAIRQRDRGRGKVSAEGRLLTGRHEVEIQTEIAVGLAGNSVGVAKQRKPMAVDVTGARGPVSAEAGLHGEASLFPVRAGGG